MNTRIVQVGICAADLPRTLRRYCEAFGFKDAGGRVLWGPRSAKIQQLGDDSNAMLWWLVGAQEFVNLEFFHHTLPAQRPMSTDWLPNALGWVRFGIAVAAFDTALACLERSSVALSAVITMNGLRRVCFKDPDIGAVVEVMEDGAALSCAAVAGGPVGSPRLVYATLSVSDLARARIFYADAMEMAAVPEPLHTPDMEALWGLAGATRDLLLLDGGGIFLELVHYIDPPGQRRSDLRLSDQGIMNVAFGYRDRPALDRAMARAMAGGGTANSPIADTEPAATYLTDPLGNSLEMLWIPASLDADYGWASRAPAYR